jgi:hypothetical protein
VARAGIPDFHFQDLRHTCASYLAMSGAELPQISAVLGHKNAQQTMKYIHLMPAHTRAVLERMAQQFLSCLLAALSWEWLWWDATGPATVAHLGQALGWW